MDARIDPAAALGIALGDAHVIRNAGACAKDALRSLVISNVLLGTEEILLVKHTGCGMLTFKNADALSAVQQKLGDGAKSELQDMDFLPFGSGDLEVEVKEDVQWLKKQRAIGAKTISGWIYEVETGKAKHVV